jgi:hypothetical protein
MKRGGKKMERVSLSPPWWILYSKICTSIGSDPTLHVQPMHNGDTVYYIDILAPNVTRGKALRTILNPQYDIGNITVYVRVFDSTGTEITSKNTDPVEKIIEAIKIALGTNPYFVEVIDTRGKLPPMQETIIGQIVIVFKKAVIQFFNDDISDYYSNYNSVAMNVFKDVLILEYPNDVKVSVTTELKRD